MSDGDAGQRTVNTGKRTRPRKRSNQSRPAAGSPANNRSDPRQERGRAGEAAACRYLEERGYDILQTNFRSRYGEIDIIARHSEVVAFIEVKARRRLSHGQPFEAVGPRKQRQIIRMAAMWVAAYQPDRILRSCAFRFDVVSIVLGTSGQIEHFLHIEDAFR